jgi:endonuclease YncB( thermonuclease family)
LAVPATTAQTLTGRITEVVDGDTFGTETSDRNRITVCLDGIDAPKSGQLLHKL